MTGRGCWRASRGSFPGAGSTSPALAVGHSETAGLSRMTFVVEGGDWVVEQVTKQLYKLIDVVRVTNISAESIVMREMALLKVKSNQDNRAEIMQIVDIFRAGIVDVGKDTVIIEVTGDEEKIDALIRLLQPFGVRETMRTGRIAMTRGGAATGTRQTASQAAESAPDTEVVP